MVYKLIDATAVKEGTAIILDNAPCIVRSVDISKTGKHGHSKVRLEAIGIIDGKKRVVVKPGHEKFEVPLITKYRGQVLSVGEKTASIMDLESYETLDITYTEEVKEGLREGCQVEYWDIDGQRIIKKVF